MTELAPGVVLPPAFYERPVLQVAPDLLGCVVTHAGVSIRLTEVEAYDGGNDPGSHAFRGRTPRTEVMFGPPGHLYVYFTYGMHFCANLVCGPDGVAAAVLLRAGEVLDGTAIARARRATRSGSDRLVSDRDLARGPARLATCLDLGRAANGIAVTDPRGAMTVRSGVAAPARVDHLRQGPRVGVSGDGGDGPRYPWRFWLDGEPTVSSYRKAVSRRAPR